MSVNDYSDLNDLHKDALLELGNIGTGSALTSLSQLVDKPIKMDLPSIKIESFDQLPDGFTSASGKCAGVVIQVHGDLECVVTFLLSEAFTKVMAEDLTGTAIQDIQDMDSMQRSAICEVGNIMCNSYLNALASLLQASLSVSVPTLNTGSNEEVLSSFGSEFLDEKPEILFIQNTFHYVDQEFKSYIMLHPKFDSLRKIFQTFSL